MRPSEAAELVSDLQAAYPSREFRSGSGKLYAEKILPFDYFDAKLAVATLVETMPRSPAVADLLAAVKEQKKQRFEHEERQGLMQLPNGEQAISLHDFLMGNPAMQERVAKLGWWTDTLAEIDAASQKQSTL